MDFGIQVLVVGVVRGLSEAVGRHPVALAHSSLALVVGGCRDTVESGSEAQNTDREVKLSELAPGDHGSMLAVYYLYLAV